MGTEVLIPALFGVKATAVLAIVAYQIRSTRRNQKAVAR